MNPLVPFLAGLIGKDLAKASVKTTQASAQRFSARAVRKSAPFIARAVGRLATRGKIGRAFWRTARRSPTVSRFRSAYRAAGAVERAKTATPTPEAINQRMDYSAMMSNMGNPNAAAEARQQATEGARSDQTNQAIVTKNQMEKTAVDTAAKALLGLGGIVTATVGAFVGVTLAAHRFAEAVTESRREFAHLNGVIGNAFAMLDVNAKLRSMRTARETQGSTASLLHATNEMRDAWQPIEKMWMTTENLIATVGAEVVAGIGNVLNSIFDGLGVKKFFADVESWMGSGTNQPGIGEQVIRAMVRAGMPAAPKRKPLPPVPFPRKKP
jgi:hypothetical protein